MLISMIGQQFGRLTVLRLGERGKYGRRWWCRCICGNETLVYGHNLIAGRTQSCGCYALEVAKEANTIHGLSGTKEYARALSRKRRNKSRQQDFLWSIELETQLRLYFDACVVCGISRDEHIEKYGCDLCVDHVRPLSRGYGLQPGNAVILCKSCNSSKKDTPLKDLPEDTRKKIMDAAKRFEEYVGIEYIPNPVKVDRLPKPRKDLTGQRFGRWTVLEVQPSYVDGGGRYHTQYLCRCDCGVQDLVLARDLRAGRSTKCQSCVEYDELARGIIGQFSILMLSEVELQRRHNRLWPKENEVFYVDGEVYIFPAVAARMLGLSIRTIGGLEAAGRLRRSDAVNKWRLVSLDSVEEYLEAGYGHNKMPVVFDKRTAKGKRLRLKLLEAAQEFKDYVDQHPELCYPGDS